MNKPKSRIENIVTQEMNNELLIYDLKDNKAFCLNETSAIIYQLCDGKRTVAEINNVIAKKLNQPVNDELIWLALDGLKKEGLLENSENFEINFNGLSRRQVIKKVGLSSLVVLPVIGSLVAPTAAATASLAVLFAICSSPSSCQSGNCISASPGVNDRCCVPGALNGAFTPTNASCNTNFANCTDYGLKMCCSGTAIDYPPLDVICFPFTGKPGCLCT